jgi:hypothetical protein
VALTNRNSVKKQANISPQDTSLDLQIDAFIAGVSGRIKRQFNRNIETQTLTEYYSGDNSPILFLKQFPIISVASVIIDDTFWFGQGPGSTPQVLVQGTDYTIMAGYYGIGSSGALRRINGMWYAWDSRRWGLVSKQPPLPNGNIQVVYTAGLSPVPPEIEMAVNLAVMKMIQMSQTGTAIASNNYQDAAESYFSPELQSQVFGSIENCLAPFTMPVI